MKKIFVLVMCLALSPIVSAVTCEDTMSFIIETSTGAVQVGIAAKVIGEKHRVKKVETEIVQSLFWFQLGIRYVGKCSRVTSALKELFDLSSEVQ